MNFLKISLHSDYSNKYNVFQFSEAVKCFPKFPWFWRASHIVEGGKEEVQIASSDSFVATFAV